MIIRFNDNTEIPLIKVQSREAYIQNSSREVYDFHFDQNEVTFEQLDTLFGDEEKVNKIYLMDDEEVTHMHEDYSIRVSLAYLPVEIVPETPNSPAQMENRFIVSMARKTYLEKTVSHLLNAQ